MGSSLLNPVMSCDYMSPPPSNTFTAEAVLSGMMTWERPSGYGRTTAQFTLTLILSHTLFPNASAGGVVVMPGRVDFGDGESSEGMDMEVGVCLFVCLSVPFRLSECVDFFKLLLVCLSVCPFHRISFPSAGPAHK